jgi:hypothetical protein
MSLIAEIREKKKLARMRLGQEAPDIVPLQSVDGVRVAIVPLTESEFERALNAAAGEEVPDNAYGTEVRDRQLQVWTLLFAIRDPADPSKRVFETVEELKSELEWSEINYLMEMYSRTVENSSPGLDNLTDEDLDEIKKALGMIDLSALSGKAWWHLKFFLLSLTAEQLKANSFGSSLTNRLIGTNDEPESTPGASES